MEMKIPLPKEEDGPCSYCDMSRLCLPAGLPQSDLLQLEHIVGSRRAVPRGEFLYRQGDPFTRLYAVRSGHWKTVQRGQGGCLVTGFQMAGDLLGLDAIADGSHGCDAVALENSEVCEIPFGRLQELVAALPALLEQFHRALSREIRRQQAALYLLGNARAEQRLALFLIDLSARYAARGMPSERLQLRMSREDIGAHLGLTMECVCRLLARFRKEGWISLTGRHLTIHNSAQLAALADGAGQDSLA